MPKQPSHQDLINAIVTFISGLQKYEITGKLWIVQLETIRIYQKND